MEQDAAAFTDYVSFQTSSFSGADTPGIDKSGYKLFEHKWFTKIDPLYETDCR